MKSNRTALLARIAMTSAVIIAFASFGMFHVVSAFLPPNLTQNQLPADAMPTCVVTPTVFATWFQSGSPSANGLVNPADSINFPDPHTNNCPFYQWSEQMFLWLTSPTTGGVVLNTPTFFDVSPPDPTNSWTRTFLPHPLNPAVINVEQSQADNSVLEAQTGSLVYYITTVNDVYAFLKTGVADGDFSPVPTAFPTTQSDLNPITSFAASKGVTIQDPNALAIMVKSAWVLAAGLPNLSTYITTTATVPTYDTSNSSMWTQNGQQTVQLALVGIHVVGSTAGHREMIWATFEHFANAPRALYRYVNNLGNLIEVDPDSAAMSWLFLAANASPAGPFNCQNMTYNPTGMPPGPPTINATSGNPCTSTTISPSNTIRWKPFGASPSQPPNPNDGAIANASNTEIISINNNIESMLPNPDVRNNYVMGGASWTALGVAPTCVFPNGPSNGPPPNLCGTLVGNPMGNIVGTSLLDNATMETYEQGVDTSHTPGATAQKTCLDCHNFNTLSVSHDFQPLQPLTTFTNHHGYTLGSFPFNLFQEVGTIAQSQIMVVPFSGFSGVVSFSASGLPKGVKASFNPKASATGTTLTLTSSANTPTGVSTIVITGTSGSITENGTVSLTLTARSFILGKAPEELTLNLNSSATSTVTIYPLDGFSDNVTLSTGKLPSGVTASFSPNPATSSSTLTLTAGPTAQNGTATVMINGTSGSVKTSTPLTLTVNAPPLGTNTVPPK
jgi:hypothetical protein